MKGEERMAIIIAALATISTGGTIFYYLHKRRKNAEKIYGIVLKKADNNVVHIGYNKKQYLVHTSDRRYARLEEKSQVAIKLFYLPDGNIAVTLD